MAENLGIKRYRGCFTKDILPKKIKERECGIINLDDFINAGTHWVCYYNEPGASEVEYFDSFGCPPPEAVVRYLHTAGKPLTFNSYQYQHTSSILCGYYCILFLNERSKGCHRNEISKLLTANPLRNEEIIKKYFR